jgi:hypothetical protein
VLDRDAIRQDAERGHGHRDGNQSSGELGVRSGDFLTPLTAG